METQSITPPPGEESARSRRQLQSGITLVNRYHIQEVIGVGGMGSVYRARDLHFPNVTKLVAVKEMINTAPDPLTRQTIIHNFEREANILATLNHPSIPRIYDYFSEEDRSYLVLEFVHGKDLEAIISDTPGFLPEEQVLTWAIQLCDVLAFLHSHKPDPIVFRDMKPSNVMINSNGDVILVDFGIAKTFQVGQKGTMIGTEGYSPPEQYRGEASPAGGYLCPWRDAPSCAYPPRSAARTAIFVWRTPDPPHQFACFAGIGSGYQHRFAIQPCRTICRRNRNEGSAHRRSTQNRCVIQDHNHLHRASRRHQTHLGIQMRG